MRADDVAVELVREVLGADSQRLRGRRVAERPSVMRAFEDGRYGTLEIGRPIQPPSYGRSLSISTLSAASIVRYAASTAITRVPASAIQPVWPDRKSTRLNSSHSQISYAVFCLKKKKKN